MNQETLRKLTVIKMGIMAELYQATRKKFQRMDFRSIQPFGRL